LSEIIERQSGAGGKHKQCDGVVNFLNLRFDLTPQKYLSMIVNEIDNIPPHSVPVIIKEISTELEDEHDILDQDDNSSSLSSSEDESNESESPFKEQVGEEDESEEESVNLISRNRMANRRKQMNALEMEECPSEEN